ncbi:MAG: hypothetical protein PHG95_03795 [Patescibacteria group bacterium]|nr:hypothetical protein [Patescibacteria group bacterium]
MSVRKINVWKIVFWFFIVGLAVFFHADHFLNGDEGVTLNGAWNLYNQRRLYFDFFSFLPPLSFYLIYWAWLVLGLSFWSAKALSILFLLAGAFGLFKIAERLRPNPINYFIPLLFVLISSWWWIINHNFYQLIFSIWSAYFLLVFLENSRWRHLLAAAFLASAGIATLQQKGLLFAFASFFIILFFNKKPFGRRSLLAAFSYGLGVAAPLLILLFFWPLALLWDNLVIFPLFHYVEANRLPYYLLALASASYLLFAWPFHSRDYRRLGLLILSGVYILSCYPLPDYYHLSMALVLLLPILPDLLDRLGQQTGFYRRVLALSGLAWLWLWPVSYFLAFLFFNFSLTKDYPFLDYVRQECPGQYLQVGPFLPNVYFETGKLSATSFDILITGHQTDAQFKRAAAQLELNRPSCAITAYPASLSRFRHQLDNPVDNFIRENYQPAFTEGQITVWKYRER